MLRFRFLFFIFLCTFVLSCSKQNVVSSPISEDNANHLSSAKAGNFAPGQLEAHYLKHGYQFGNITQEQYLENAQSLLDASPGNDILEKRRDNGDILHYKVSTGEFAVMARNGRIRTYFKANYQYWLKQ